jgi:hypothetical protein
MDVEEERRVLGGAQGDRSSGLSKWQLSAGHGRQSPISAAPPTGTAGKFAKTRRHGTVFCPDQLTVINQYPAVPSLKFILGTEVLRQPHDTVNVFSPGAHEKISQRLKSILMHCTGHSDVCSPREAHAAQ